MLQFIRIIRQFIKKVGHDSINAFSAHAAFFIIISAFPFIMVLLNLIQFFPINESYLSSIILRAMPDELDPLVMNILEELYTKSSGTLLSLTLIVTIWSASRGMLAIVRGLNAAYSIQENRNYFVLRFISCLYTLVFLIIIVSSLLTLVFGNKLYHLITIRFPFLEALASMMISIRIFFFLGVLTLFFILIYKAIPNRHSKAIHQVPGAIFASLGWVLFSFGFSVYIDHFSSMSYMYGSLTAIVLLMLWLYFCMYIVFLGGEINHFFEPMIAEGYLRLQNWLSKLKEKAKKS